MEDSVGSSCVLDSTKSHATRSKNSITVSKSAKSGRNFEVKGAEPQGHSSDSSTDEEVAADDSGAEDVQG